VQLTLLLPLFVLLRVADGVVFDRHDQRQASLDACRIVIAAAMVIVVAIRLFREDSYFVAVLPLAAALGAQLLAGPGPGATPMWRIVQRVLAISTLLLTCVAAVGYVNAWDLLEPGEVDELGPTFHQLLTSPPIDALQPAETALQIPHAEWSTMDRDRRKKILLRYMHDCTRGGDRILVTGSTPYDVDYYADRPIAGGHIEWHHGWRSDPVHARQSLQLLQSQSVPFAFSTNDPVLDDLGRYPDIRHYFEQNYGELEGSHGQLLVDRRRQPTGRFGALGFPCFR
jgi:hypothetical protein